MKKGFLAVSLLLAASIASAAPEVNRQGRLGSLVNNIPSNGPRKLPADDLGTWGGAAVRFLRDNPELIGVTGGERFIPRKATADALGEVHIRVKQEVNDLPVIGAELIVHANAGTGEVRMVNGRAISAAEVPTKVAIEGKEAVLQAVDEAIGTDWTADADPRLVYLMSTKGSLHLAWTATIRYVDADGEQVDDVFADAETGVLIERHPRIHRVRNRITYSANNGTSLPGTQRITETGALTGDAAIDGAHTGAGTTYDYYKARFNRDSYNNAGATMKSTAHYSTSYNNAFWNGTQMVYGDGDGSQFRAFSLAFDVVAHELTHAVTENEAGLVYQNESGALNEAMSDIFAAAAEAYKSGGITANTWKIGEDCYTPATAGDALRYMNNPTADGSSRDYYPERYVGTGDYGGVHINSGIANLAFYLLVNGGTHPRGKTTVSVPSIGMSQAEQIFYRALTLYMTSGSNFADARAKTIQSATELYGATAADAVGKAWDAVGVAGPAAATRLTNGVAVSSLSGATGSWRYYVITVPTGQTKFEVVQSGGTGDADLYVKRGAQPTSSSYDYRPYLNGNNETVTVTNPVAGEWYIGIYSYSAYSGLSIKATYSTTTTPPPTGCTSVSGSLSSGGNSYQPSTSGYTSSVSGTHTGKLTGPSTADFDLYLQKWNGSSWAIVGRGETSTSTENVSYSGTSGTYRWRVYAYSGSGSFTLCTTKP